MPDIWCDITAGDAATLAGVLGHAPVDRILALPSQVDALAEARLPERITVVTDDDPSVLRLTVDDGPSLAHARERIGTVDHLIVRFTDPTNIPLELLLAAAQETRTRIVKQVSGVDDAVVTAGVLESGPAGLLFAVSDVNGAAAITRDILRTRRQRLTLIPATVTAVRHAGMGFRGCVDTTWLFGEDEGMLVGSTSSGGFVVCAEVHYLPYMNLRPFRVNAGAVHSYVWASDGQTEYVTDLAAGSTVLAVSTSGDAYPVRVGRVKTELRPLRLIEARAGDVALSVFVQDDWHVRLFGADGKPRNCTTIVPGDDLLAYVCEPGRHVGIKVTEAIVER